MNDVTITLTIPYLLVVVMVAWVPVGLATVAVWHRLHRVTMRSSWRRYPYEFVGGILIWPLVLYGMVRNQIRS